MIGLMMLAAVGGSPAFYPAKELAELCREARYTTCSAFIEGVNDTAEALRVACPPRNWQRGETREVGIASVADPRLADHEAAVVVLEALKRRWPCPK